MPKIESIGKERQPLQRAAVNFFLKATGIATVILACSYMMVCFMQTLSKKELAWFTVGIGMVCFAIYICKMLMGSLITPTVRAILVVIPMWAIVCSKIVSAMQH
jgi:hypothetical protein